MSSVTPTWGAVVQRADEQLTELRLALETAPIERVEKLQAAIAVWRDVLALPETLAPDTDLDPNPVPYS